MPTTHQELEQALAYHRQGLLDQAAQSYQAILLREPAQWQALYGLGILLRHQQPERAITLLGRAATLRPQTAAIHAQLGAAYRELGRLDQAESCYRLAIHLAPQAVDCIEHLGLILFNQGKPAAAIEQFQQVLRLQPDRAGTYNLLGAACQQAGDRPQALAHFRRAVQLDPCLPDAHSNLGQLLLESNAAPEALFHCEEAVRLEPGSAAAHVNLGNVWSALGRFAEARAAYAEAIRLAPQLALSYNNLGRVLQQEGRLAEAVHWFRQALDREPTALRFRIHLAAVLMDLEQFDEAIGHYHAVLAIDPRSAEAYNGLGQIQIELGRYEEAVRCFRTAVALRPDWATAHSNLGTALQQLGDFEPALASLRTALRIPPPSASVLGQLAAMLRDRLPAEELTLARQLLNEPGLADVDRSALHFGLAQVHDAHGDYARAAKHLERANALQEAVLRQRGQACDPAEQVRYVDALCSGFSPAYFARVQGFGLDTEVPVFIVGLPRSGTTLVEQILASHSRIASVGESAKLPRSFDALPQLLQRAEPAPACLPYLDAATVGALAQHQLAWLRERDAAAERIIDKLPQNHLLLGWIVTLFPQARIIHCRRDLRDVALSCWMTNFRWVSWASDPRHITSWIGQYQRLMAHWRAVLPAPIREVIYEDLVADPEGIARGLVAFCGLEWEPPCLEFYRTRRPITSASVMQVRQPIYTTSVGRWRHYAPYLASLFAKLPVQGSTG